MLISMAHRVTNIAALVAILLSSACTSFTPGSLADIPLHERAQTLEQDGLVVSVTVLSRDEAANLFGANLHDRSVQPVWLEIENRTNKDFWLMLHGIDPNYFSAREVAYMNHKSFSGKANKEMDQYFSSLGIKQYIPPGQIRSGFAFSNETIGTKEVRVKMLSRADVRDFEFFILVPGMISEWNKKDLKSLYPDNELVHVETEEELEAAIKSLPCCIQREFGTGVGEPLNVVLIGNSEALKALIKAGWDESVFQTDLQSIFGAAYLYGRPPDVQFEKTRRKVDSTNLLRVWVTPIRFRGKAVSVGSIKRNIDPNIDESAIYIIEDLATAGMIKRFGLVGGIPPVSKNKPKRTFANSPYWTRGNRLVIEIAEEPVQLDSLETFAWDWEGEVFKGTSTEEPAPEASP